MHFLLSYECCFLLLALPIVVRALVLQSQTNISQSLIQANSPNTTIDVGGNVRNEADPLTASWCRPPNADLDLFFTTKGGQPLLYNDVIWAIGVIREVAVKEMERLGKQVPCGQNTLRVKVKDIVVVLLDEKLAERPWSEVHDMLDIVLLCVFQKRVAVELMGTLFDIARRERVASIAIREATKESGGGGDVAEE